MDGHNNPDRLTHYEFKGLKGISSDETDNHDGFFSASLCGPFCKLKESGNKKIIEYTEIGGTWELEIVSLSENELTLSNSATKWTYARYQIKKR